MARCIECEFYITAEQTGDNPGCASDGDVTNPEEDIYCGEVDGFDGDIDAWEKSKRATIPKN